MNENYTNLKHEISRGVQNNTEKPRNCKFEIIPR